MLNRGLPEAPREKQTVNSIRGLREGPEPESTLGHRSLLPVPRVLLRNPKMPRASNGGRANVGSNRPPGDTPSGLSEVT